MKAIILGITTAAAAVTATAVPAGATGMSAIMTGNNSYASSSYTRMGIGPNGVYFEGESVRCHTSNGSFNFGFGAPAAQPNNQAAQTGSCNAQQVINNPPANSTVTINGLCDEQVKAVKTNVSGGASVVVNSTGPCADDGKTTQPVTVVVTKNDDGSKPATVKTASATGNSGPVTLPETGLSDITLLSGGLAVLAYGATLAARAFRARA